MSRLTTPRSQPRTRARPAAAAEGLDQRLHLVSVVAAACPAIERRLTRGHALHNLLQRPRDAPVRTSPGAMAITFYIWLLIASVNDIIARRSEISLNAMTSAGRIGLLLLPPLAYSACYRICQGLQRTDRAALEHGIETGVIRRLPHGEFVEIHQPLAPRTGHGNDDRTGNRDGGGEPRRPTCPSAPRRSSADGGFERGDGALLDGRDDRRARELDPPALPVGGDWCGGELDADVGAGIEEALTSYLHRRRGEAGAVDPSFTQVADVLVDFVLGGGKRLRPRFAWWGWRGAGMEADGRRADQVLRAVSALELVHAAALVHDDLMDGSTRRRGNPAVHVLFERLHQANDGAGSADQFGGAMAVLLGDLALFWAEDMLASAGLVESARRRVRPVWARMRTELVGGQFLDVSGQAFRRAETRAGRGLEWAMRVNQFKTAGYTVARPLQVGAALAGAPSELLETYERFGLAVGAAFQLRDDLLDLFGDPEVTGKPVGKDVSEGKPTVLIALAFRAAHACGHLAASRLLADAWGKPTLDSRELARVQTVVEELGVAREMERRIAGCAESALAALNRAQVAEPAKTRLIELAGTATRRVS